MRLDASPWARRQLTDNQRRVIRAAQPAEAVLGVSAGRDGWNARIIADRHELAAAQGRASAWGAAIRALRSVTGACRCGRVPVRVGPYRICRNLSCPVLVVSHDTAKGATV
jgi:hypothetical protein